MGFRLNLPLLVSVILISALANAAVDDLTIKSAERTIDVSTQLVKVTNRLTLTNSGKSPIKSFAFPIEPKYHEKLSFFRAQLTDGEKSLATKQGSSGSYTVELKEPLEAGKSVKVQVDLVYAKHLNPHPAEITQREKQLVQYRGNAYLYSPYKVGTQTTKVLLSSSNVESYTKVKPSSQSDTTVTYGPYESVAPLSEEEVVIHYENNSPFLTVSSLIRHIEVSHWGNIAVEETVDAYHNGAKLKGSFSRFEYQREQSGVSSVKAFKTLLPPSAKDVYYRDEIGNISTSNLREGDDSVELELRPRFPLFGGWKTHYVVGYNIPSYEYLFNSGNDYVLQMKLIDHIFDDMIVDDAHIRIILPEGATNIELDAPYPVTRLPDSLHYTYLDTKGRPVVEISAKNLVENHIQDFKLHYTFSPVLMFQEPLLCVAAFFLLFLTVIVYVRLDFSITKEENHENRQRSNGVVETLRSKQNKRFALYCQYEDQIARLKASKDLNVFQVSVKTIKDELKIHKLDAPGNTKSETPAFTEKLEMLKKHDKMLKEFLASHGTLVEKFVNGKISKQNFNESEAALTKKKEDAFNKIKQIMTAL